MFISRHSKTSQKTRTFISTQGTWKLASPSLFLNLCSTDAYYQKFGLHRHQLLWKWPRFLTHVTTLLFPAVYAAYTGEILQLPLKWIAPMTEMPSKFVGNYRNKQGTRKWSLFYVDTDLQQYGIRTHRVHYSNLPRSENLKSLIINRK
jgi:hypothetical protein